MATENTSAIDEERQSWVPMIPPTRVSRIARIAPGRVRFGEPP